MVRPLIVNAALTGMVPRRPDVPDVPVTPDQIVADGEACFAAGARILHLHARDDDQEPEWRREAYAEIVAELRRRCAGVVLCVTTSGRRVSDLAKRADVLDLDGDSRPDMASLTLGSLNFRDQASVNPPDVIVALLRRMRERGIRPELEVFDSGMVHLAERLLRRGELEEPLWFNLLLGGPNTAPARGRDLVHLVESLPPGSTWAAGGIGVPQLAMNGLAIFMGGHVRTGLEDNPWWDEQRTRTTTNSELVERVVAIAEHAGRPVATPEETRSVVGVSAGGGSDGAVLAAAGGAGRTRAT